MPRVLKLSRKVVETDQLNLNYQKICWCSERIPYVWKAKRQVVKSMLHWLREFVFPPSKEVVYSAKPSPKNECLSLLYSSFLRVQTCLRNLLEGFGCWGPCLKWTHPCIRLSATPNGNPSLGWMIPSGRSLLSGEILVKDRAFLLQKRTRNNEPNPTD